MGVIQRQSVKNFFTSYIGIVIGFVNVLVIQPRFLSPEVLGLTKVLYSFSMLLSTVVPMGLANITIRFFPYFKHAQRRHHGFFGLLFYGTLIGFFLTSLLLLASREFFIARYNENSALFASYFNWVFPLIFFLAFITQINVYCFSLYKSTIPLFINDVVIRIGIIVVVSLYYLGLFSLKAFIMLFIGTYGFQIVLLMIYVFYEDKPGFRFNWQKVEEVGWQRMVGFGLILWISSVSYTGLRELATVYLGMQMTLDLVAIYVVASFIPTLIEIPLNALDKIATFNITSALARKDMLTVGDIYRKSARYMLLIGGFLFLLINGNIESLLQFLPEKFREGGGVVFILSFGTLFNMATGLNSQILVYSGKYYYGSLTIILALVFNFTLQVWLIPVFGIEGAALATAASGIILNGANTLIVWRHYHLHPVEQATWKSVLLIAAVAAVDYLTPPLAPKYLDIVLHGALIMLLFGGVVYRMRMIPEMNEFVAKRVWKK